MIYKERDRMATRRPLTVTGRVGREMEDTQTSKCLARIEGTMNEVTLVAEYGDRDRVKHFAGTGNEDGKMENHDLEECNEMEHKWEHERVSQIRRREKQCVEEEMKQGKSGKQETDEYNKLITIFFLIFQLEMSM